MQNAEISLYNQAYRLSLFTIIYNIAEGLVSMILGYEDETLTLFGFGADSFIEVMSGIGIAVMITRFRNNPESSRSGFETAALRITGTAFYILVVSLVAGVVVNIFRGHKPETTIWGVIISLISIIVMTWLMLAKKKTGRKLNSGPILADANCTRVCIYMSVVLLIASVVYELTGFAYADAIGVAGLAYFSFPKERKPLRRQRGRRRNAVGED